MRISVQDTPSAFRKTKAPGPMLNGRSWSRRCSRLGIADGHRRCKPAPLPCRTATAPRRCPSRRAALIRSSGAASPAAAMPGSAWPQPRSSPSRPSASRPDKSASPSSPGAGSSSGPVPGWAATALTCLSFLGPVRARRLQFRIGLEAGRRREGAKVRGDADRLRFAASGRRDGGRQGAPQGWRQRGDIPQLAEEACGFDAGRQHDLPKAVRADQETEFVSRDLDLRAYQRGVTLGFSKPGKLIANALRSRKDHASIGRLNGKVRAECLNAHWFLTLAGTREVEAWRRGHTEVRVKTGRELYHPTVQQWGTGQSRSFPSSQPLYNVQARRRKYQACSDDVHAERETHQGFRRPFRCRASRE